MEGISGYTVMVIRLRYNANQFDAFDLTSSMMCVSLSLSKICWTNLLSKSHFSILGSHLCKDALQLCMPGASMHAYSYMANVSQKLSSQEYMFNYRVLCSNATAPRTWIV